MNSKRTLLGVLAIGVGAIVVVSYLIFAGRVATRDEIHDNKSQPPAIVKPEPSKK